MAKAEKQEIGLPKSIAAAWGISDRAARGPKPALSLGRIVEAAIRVADRDGLNAVSMSAVAREAGASTMALYRYVDAKDELLQLMVDAVYGPPPAPTARDEPVREGLRRWAWGVLRVFRAHPWVLRVPITGPPITPNAVTWFESGLQSLRDTGLDENEKMETVLLLSVFVRGIEAALLEVREAFLQSARTDQEAMSGYGTALARLIDPHAFPALHRAIGSGVMDAEDDPDEEFIFGLERVLDGIDAYIARCDSDPVSNS